MDKLYTLKKFYLYFVLLSAISILKLNAQNDCSTAFPYLTSSGISYAAGVNAGSAPIGVNYGCLASQPNPTWFYLGICTAGTIVLDITTSGGADVDFIAWGPFTNASTMCNSIFGGASFVDCSFSTASSEQVNLPNTMPGEYYILMVTNYSNLAGTINITTGAGTTGVACDSSLVPPPCASTYLPTQQICKVSTNFAINKNIVVWNKDSAYVGNYEIQKETTTMNVYSTIGIVPSTDSSVFEDAISNPIQQAFNYKIKTADTCGNVRYSTVHRTIHLLTNYNTFTGYPQLAWNNYQGFNYFTYYIYRGTSPQTLSMYDSISASLNSYTDVTPLAGANYYAIAVNPPNSCSPWRAMDLSFSNVSPVFVTSIQEIGESLLSIYPNPSTGIVNVSFGNNLITGKLSLVDITGRELLISAVQNANQVQLDASSFSAGFYYLMLQTETGTVRKNVVVSK